MNTNTLDKTIVEKISEIKQEPEWMRTFRLRAFQTFQDLENPKFGPSLPFDFNSITYYKKLDDKVHTDWGSVPKEARDTFDQLGILDAEKKYLGGIGAQYESEVIYHNMIKELEEKHIIFCDTDTALRKYPELFRKYFNKLVAYDENKYTALNGAVWSGGTFIYVPPHTTIDRPLQSYFRINSKNMGQFERTLIIVDDDSHLHYMEGCTAPTYTDDSLHAAVVEIYVGKNASCRYTTIQNWSTDVYNLVTKRATVSSYGKMEWIDGNIGSHVNMKYPCCILKGEGATGNCISVAISKGKQKQDTGAKMIHLAPHTISSIISKSIALDGGESNYRGKVYIGKQATDSQSSVKCDTILLDDQSKSDTIPTNIVENESALLNHEATVSKISEEKLFYLQSRGVSKERAKELLMMGFIDTLRAELPMEYAVELNHLLKNYF